MEGASSRVGPGLARLFMGEGKGAPRPASAGSFPPGGAGMLRPRDELLVDPRCPQERQIPVPGRKFLTEDDGSFSCSLRITASDVSVLKPLVPDASPDSVLHDLCVLPNVCGL